MDKTFGGRPQCTEENMEYALKKLKEYNDSKIKYTFRQWLNRTMNVIDLIDWDQLITPVYKKVPSSNRLEISLI